MKPPPPQARYVLEGSSCQTDDGRWYATPPVVGSDREVPMRIWKRLRDHPQGVISQLGLDPDRVVVIDVGGVIEEQRHTTGGQGGRWSIAARHAPQLRPVDHQDTP